MFWPPNRAYKNGIATFLSPKSESISFPLGFCGSSSRVKVVILSSFLFLKDIF